MIPFSANVQYNVPTTNIVVPRSARRRCDMSSSLFLGLLIAFAPQIFISQVAAMPLALNIETLQRRDLDSQISPRIWIPILVICGFLALLSILSCQRHNLRRRLAPFWSRVTTANSANTDAQGPRELTAEQLVGNNGASAPASATPGRTRRNRRPRRTPSQISTTSLPAYNKDPGEQELVIFRGPQDMEDAMPATVVMLPLSEDAEDLMHSRDDSQTTYLPMPASPNDMPLLQSDEPSTDDHVQNRQPPGVDRPRQSVETLNSSESSLMRVTNNAPAYDDPRGEAPAYFEAVDLSQDTLGDTPGASTANIATSSASSPAAPPHSPEPAPHRRSGLRTLLNSLPNRISMHGTSHSSHTRADSSISMVSSDVSHGREASRSRTSHRATPSGSGSLLSLSPFRTISRQKSTTTLHYNSPSLISLNSISAPLTHTVVRTDFTYPKSGPTPEQLMLISSRESFARFGVPYGADAIAYAASASRQDLDVPPPDFDVQSPEASSSAGPSRLRAASNATDIQQVVNDDDDDDSSLRNNTEPSDISADIPPAPRTSPPPVTASPPTPGLAASSSDVSGSEAPPSSFRVPTTVNRSESRASSIQSYATAAESVIPLQTPMGPDNPQTERLGGQHTLEHTDTTITQASATGVAI